MKAIKKEIVIIVLLAILATGFSFFAVKGERYLDCPETSRLCIGCCSFVEPRGWPLAYFLPLEQLNYDLGVVFVLSLIIDFLFYFFLLKISWTILKRIIKR